MTPDASSPLERFRPVFERVYDPEFGVSVADLGLIYDVTEKDGHVVVTMTLTSMYCPAGDVILAGVKSAAEAVPGVAQATVNLVWDPLWSPDRLTARARKDLGWDETKIES